LQDAAAKGPIRVALVGLGSFAQTAHLPALSSHPDLRLVAICDPDPATQRRLATNVRYPLPAFFDSSGGLLDWGAFDVAGVCTPNDTHLGLAEALVEARKHVLVEKPLEGSRDRLRALRDSAMLQCVSVRINHSLRLHAAARQLARYVWAVDSPVTSLHLNFTHGGPETVGLRASWYRSESRSLGGVVADLGSHLFDLCSYLSGGQWATAVRWRGSKDLLGSTVGFESELSLSRGGGAHVRGSWSHRGGVRANALIIMDKLVARAEFLPSPAFVVFDRRGGNGSPLRISISWSQDRAYKSLAHEYWALGRGLPGALPGIRSAEHYSAIRRAMRRSVSGEWRQVDRVQLS